MGDVKKIRATRRVDIRAILSNANLRKELFIGVIIATQAREGINTTLEQATRAYEKIQIEKIE